jgi:ABC-type multidrug transport system ATPase subunit
MLENAELPAGRKIRTFSKGMKRQVSVLLGVCANTKYLLCDETFDGLDPVMRQAVKSVFASEMIDREFTPIIASHNMRELEDICDHIGLMHGGRILFSENLEDMKFHMQKVQCVIGDKAREEGLPVSCVNNRGKGRERDDIGPQFLCDPLHGVVVLEVVEGAGGVDEEAAGGEGGPDIG